MKIFGEHHGETFLDPVTRTLCRLMIFFCAVLIGVEYFFKDDAQVFQVITNVLTGITGAFLGRINPQKGAQGAPGIPGLPGDAIGASVTATSTVTTTPISENK